MARGSTNNMGRRAVGRRGGEKVVNSGQRATAGTSAYQLTDAPSATEFRAGMLEHKEGFDKSDAPDSRKGTRRNPIAAQSMGARYHITPNVNAVVPQEPTTLRQTRVVPAVSGTGRNFWATGRSYGAL